jgi:hypothetical protein
VRNLARRWRRIRNEYFIQPSFYRDPCYTGLLGPACCVRLLDIADQFFSTYYHATLRNHSGYLPFVRQSCAATPARPPSISQYRFSPYFSQDDSLNNQQQFALRDLLWESRFHQDGVGFNAANGMTYNGIYFDMTIRLGILEV